MTKFPILNIRFGGNL